MAESYEARIQAAQAQLESALAARDRFYPGSPEWEDASAKANEWMRTIEDLRRAQAER